MVAGQTVLAGKGNLDQEDQDAEVTRRRGRPDVACPGRVLAAVLLASLAAGVWMLPSPLRAAGGEKPAKADAKAGAPTASDVPAFDLTYIPDDAIGVFAIHPAATSTQGNGQVQEPVGPRRRDGGT